MFEWDLTVKIPLRIMGIDPSNMPEKLLATFTNALMEQIPDII